MKTIGKMTWVIPDMYWPEITSEGHYVSHESICVINTNSEDCSVEIELYYEDRDSFNVYSNCLAKRTHHIRMDQIKDMDGNHIPRGVAYAAVVKCSIPCVVQYTRVDTTQPENAIMTAIGFAVD